MGRRMKNAVFGLAAVVMLAGCGQQETSGEKWNNKGDITVVAPEAAPETEAALKEVFEIGEDLSKEAKRKKDAEEIRSVVSENEYAIGCISADELDSSVKAVRIDGGVEAAGIAIIVNHKNTNTKMTKEQVKAIFTGELSAWNEVLPGLQAEGKRFILTGGL